MNGFEIFHHLDIVALRHADDDRFIVLTQPPAWFVQLWPEGNFTKPFALRNQSAFLDNFLTDAGLHWRDRDENPLRSGPFIEAFPDGRNLPLEATALVADDERVLILAHLGEDYEVQRSILQSARENLLTQEQLEVEVARRTQSIRDREFELSARLIYAAGHRDEETGAHIKRIGLYSAVMAKAIGWSSTDCADIAAAAPMHDIGKIGIPDNILKKPGTLTPEERVVMETHAAIGADILRGSDIPMLKMASDIAGGHHENWDGTGYPHGLSGKDIPVSARIVAIVDVYDALVHKRVYKVAFSEADALDLMREMRGTKFDPGLFDVFLDYLPQMREIRTSIQDER